uniref:Uncharacterized protein n=1 Tax=Arundo donax TaxID=35708 RepID=A0A0A9MAQ9_ARUDO
MQGSDRSLSCYCYHIVHPSNCRGLHLAHANLERSHLNL